MKRISPRLLLLTELMILFLFFSFAAVVCTTMFVKAHETGNNAQLLNRAVTEATSVAETLKVSDGNLKKAGAMMYDTDSYRSDSSRLVIYYDDKLQAANKNSSSYVADITKNVSKHYIKYNIIFKDTEKNKAVYELDFKAFSEGAKDNGE